MALLPAIVFGLLLLAIHRAVTTEPAAVETTGLVEMGSASDAAKTNCQATMRRATTNSRSPPPTVSREPPAGPVGAGAARRPQGTAHR